VTPRETAVVVEDVITTGGSTQDVIEALNAAGAKVAAAGSIIDRSGGHAALGVPRAALVTLEISAHDPEECPLCAKGLPLVKPGSRPT
jgi:orotate phosphoribosyltransferase